MRTCHRQIQRTGHRLARYQSRFLALTALQQSRPSAHIQIALELLRIVPMTCEALNLKERLNLTRKQHIGWHLQGIGPRSGQEQHGGGELDSFGLHAN